MAEPLYVGVFLTPESRAKLLSFVPPIFKDVYADHMTIMFHPYDLLLENLTLGKTVKLRVIAHARNEKVQAVAVIGVLSANHDAHITISVNKEKGGRPNDSNDMLRTAFMDEQVQLANVNIDLEGVVDVFPRSKTQEQGDLNNG
jgi:hypothetical protein